MSEKKTFRGWLYLTLITYSFFLILIGLHKASYETLFEGTHILVWLIIASIFITVMLLFLSQHDVKSEESLLLGCCTWLVFIATILFTFAGNHFFFNKIHKVQWDYVALSGRKTDDKECYIKYRDIETRKVLYVDGLRREIYYDEHGLQKQVYRDPVKPYKDSDCEFFDPLTKSNITTINTKNYFEIKSKLKLENTYVHEKKYIYWQAAVADGYKSKKKSNTIVNALYTVLEYSQLTTPSIFFILVLNLITQLATRFKYSLLNLWFD